MPFKSKAQMAWMHAAEERGEVPKGTAKRWAEHTPDISKLPKRKKPKKKPSKKKVYAALVAWCRKYGRR